jgi:hypothetical protein
VVHGANHRAGQREKNGPAPRAYTSKRPKWYSLTAAFWTQLASIAADGQICPSLGGPTGSN